LLRRHVVRLREQHAPLKRCVIVRAALACAGAGAARAAQELHERAQLRGRADMTDGFWHARITLWYGMQHGPEQRVSDSWIGCSMGLLDEAAQAARAR
jgi:hypothetical protein